MTERVLPDRLIRLLADRQHGVVERTQLLAAGLSERMIDRRVASGALIRLYPGVYAVGHRRLRREGLWLAAVLAGGPGAALSHRSAAAAWGLQGDRSTRVDVTVGGARGRAVRGLDVHRTRLRPLETTTRHGLRITTPARTLLDLADVVSAPQLERALEEAARLRLYDGRALRRCLERANGRRGRARLQAAIDLIDPAAGETRSRTETLALRIVEAGGLPRPLVNTLVGDDEVDLLWRQQRLIVELDSRGHHLTPRAFEEDRRRDARHLAAGYRTLRFTYRQVERDPEYVAAALRAALRPAPRPATPPPALAGAAA